MSKLTRDGTAEPVSRYQILRHARGEGNIHFPCSADHEQDWQPYPVDPYSAICDDHTCIRRFSTQPSGLFFWMKLMEWRMASSKLDLDGGLFGNLWPSWFLKKNQLRHAHACHSLATRYFSVLLFPVYIRVDRCLCLLRMRSIW